MHIQNEVLLHTSTQNMLQIMHSDNWAYVMTLWSYDKIIDINLLELKLF
jgi:hypothetical protein